MKFDNRSLLPSLARIVATEALPKASEHLERTASDLSQVVIWLVGLASSLLVLAVANPDRVMAIAGRDYQRLCSLLLAVVACGVLCRVLSLWSAAIGRMQIFNLGLHLAGFLAGLGLERPDELDTCWDRAEIVARLRAFSGEDWDFLLKETVPIETCRKVYGVARGGWQDREKRGLAELTSVVAAFSGEKVKDDKAIDYDVIRWKTIVGRIVAIACGLLFLAMACAFVAAMFLVARGLRHLV